jgi:hypothetical protein
MATRKTVRKTAHRAAKAKAPATPAQVILLLNGQSAGMHTPVAGETVGSVANEIARGAGLKSYSILVNGTKIDATGAGNGLKGVTSIETFAKETRGNS